MASILPLSNTLANQNFHKYHGQVKSCKHVIWRRQRVKIERAWLNSDQMVEPQWHKQRQVGRTRAHEIVQVTISIG